VVCETSKVERGVCDIKLKNTDVDHISVLCSNFSVNNPYLSVIRTFIKRTAEDITSLLRKWYSVWTKHQCQTVAKFGKLAVI
jgi:hypothetical protein